ncbi:uncharacterized protein LOC113368094 [Ctenocephalides felis]|uniref:uncharacterized protein LOC113368094 n=1 Tax=Ctenocephalides felis TaxID=7515 RepID=UPI000E6E31F2|nr:uncharacterized protein LOC113368094 [Ctenocephalides felis]
MHSIVAKSLAIQHCRSFCVHSHKIQKTRRSRKYIKYGQFQEDSWKVQIAKKVTEKVVDNVINIRFIAGAFFVYYGYKLNKGYQEWKQSLPSFKKVYGVLPDKESFSKCKKSFNNMKDTKIQVWTDSMTNIYSKLPNRESFTRYKDSLKHLTNTSYTKIKENMPNPKTLYEKIPGQKEFDKCKKYAYKVKDSVQNYVTRNSKKDE